jgi:hypothetical protein
MDRTPPELEPAVLPDVMAAAYVEAALSGLCRRICRSFFYTPPAQRRLPLSVTPNSGIV